jgi:hypothetical protein
MFPVTLVILAVVFQNARNQAEAGKAAAAVAAADADTARRNTIIIAVVVAVGSVVGALLLIRAVKGVIFRAKQVVSLQRGEKMVDEVTSYTRNTTEENMMVASRSVNRNTLSGAESSGQHEDWEQLGGGNSYEQSRQYNGKVVIRTANCHGVVPSSSTMTSAGTATTWTGASGSAGTSRNSSSSRASSSHEGPWGGMC